MGPVDVVPSPEITEAAPADNGSVDWGDLADYPTDVDETSAFLVEGDVSEPIESPAEEVAATTSPAPVQTEQLVPPAPTPQEAQPTAAVPPAESPAPAPISTQPAIDPEAFRAQYRESLQADYGLSEEDAAAFQVDPASVMPRLAANMHMRVMQDVVRHVEMALKTVPAMMEQRLAFVQQEDAAKQEFFSEWPGLSEHYSAVLQNAKLARQANPTATKAQLIQMAGVLTATALGLDPAAVGKVRVGTPPPPAAPAKPVQAAPFKPAAAGSAPGGFTEPELGLYEAFAAEDEAWMRG